MENETIIKASFGLLFAAHPLLTQKAGVVIKRQIKPQEGDDISVSGSNTRNAHSHIQAVINGFTQRTKNQKC